MSWPTTWIPFPYDVGECEKVKKIWNEVCATLSKIIEYPIPVILSVLLLNGDSQFDFSKLQKIVWLAGFTSEKTDSSTTLYTSMWLIQLQDIIMLEISTAQVNSAQISTIKIWTIAEEKSSKYIAQ